jgi:hypothetical protein
MLQLPITNYQLSNISHISFVNPNNAALLLPQLHIVNCKLKIELTGACSC